MIVQPAAERIAYVHVVPYSVLARIQSAEKRRAGRTAMRRRTIRMRKHGSAFCKRGKVRRYCTVIRKNRIVPLMIGHEHDEVRFFIHFIHPDADLTDLIFPSAFSKPLKMSADLIL